MDNFDKSVLNETNLAILLMSDNLSLIDVALYKGWSQETYEKVCNNIKLINRRNI